MAAVTHPDAWHALVDHLSARGIRTVFGLPGDDMAVLRALDRSDVRALLCRDQRAAVHQATGYALQSGRPAVCLVGKGPAVTNTVTGLLEARYSNAPVVLVAGGTGADRRGSGAFQEVDQLPLVAPLVKWSHRVDDPARVAPAIAKALQVAAHGVPGPVYLELPDHLIGVPVPQPLPWPDEPIRAVGVDGGVDHLLPVIRAARRPVLLVGGGLRHAGAQPVVAGFAARTGAAIFVTASGRGTVDEDDPAFCGLAGLYAPGPARRLWRATDLVIALGTRLEETAVQPAGFAGPEVPVIQVNLDPAGWSAEVAGPRVLGDGVAVLRRWLDLLERDGGGPAGGWAATVAACRREMHAEARARRATMARSDRIHVAELLAALDAAAPPDRILVQENGLQDMWSYCYPYWTCPAGSGSVVPSEHTSLGFGAAAAAGVALAAPGRLVAALVGDGAFAVAHGELRGLADAHVGVLYLVLRNGGYGWLAHQWEPLAGGHSRYRFVDPDASLCLPRDDRLWHAVVDRKAGLDDALREALTVVGKGLPAVLEIPVHLDDVPPPAEESGDVPPPADESAGGEVPAPEQEEVPQ